MNLFMEGAAGIAGAAILMGLSRCILVVAESGMIMDTIVYGISILLSGIIILPASSNAADTNL